VTTVIINGSLSPAHGLTSNPKFHYLQRCLAGEETECPRCAREHGVIREIRRNNERLADQHDVFLSEVQENGFKAIAGAFSRGFLNTTHLENVMLP
jgi:hypothetical protein